MRRELLDNLSTTEWTYLEHCLVHRIDKVPAWLQFLHGQSFLLLLLVLEKHPVGELHVVAPGLALPLVHPAVSEGRAEPPPVQGEVDEVDEGGHQGQGDHGDGDDGDGEGVDGRVVDLLPGPASHQLTPGARVSRGTEAQGDLALLLASSGRSAGAPAVEAVGVLRPGLCQLAVLAGVAGRAGAAGGVS